MNRRPTDQKRTFPKSTKDNRNAPPSGRRPNVQRDNFRDVAPALNPNIMRQSNFSGRLHRGHVSDEAGGIVCHQKRECGGCVYVNTDYATSLRRKFDDGLKLLKDVDVISGARIIDPVPSPNTTAYRSLFKLAVRPASKEQIRKAEWDGYSRRFAIGLFEPGTHKVGVSMTGCPLHVAPLTNLLKDLESEIELTSLNPFDEIARTGDVRYVVARSSHITGEVMLVWVVANAVKNELVKITNKLRRMGHKINSAFMNINTSPGNAIFGEEMVHLVGGLGLRENICELNLEIGPHAFFQINPWQANNLYRRVELHAGRARSENVAWDLYTGTGQLGLILARSGYKTLGIEEVAEATEDARNNAARNGLSDKITFIAAKVEESENILPDWSRKPNVIVVNPSRRGLHDMARGHLAHVLRTNPDCKFIYVSCEAATMARDLAKLIESGHRVRQIEAFDMFAQTDKLEWIAVLTK
ncbi:MAG: 23S rRNA (uracil(1939)-C(5))-methyltransferase RlmD [Proteobacteria bacterium]|nr:23S rRNA (uracil(1939)-C(5))-methyltransferase RlmD [Pseudomonadota bacterium]